jgi:hypothetical protein
MIFLCPVDFLLYFLASFLLFLAHCVPICIEPHVLPISKHQIMDGIIALGILVYKSRAYTVINRWGIFVWYLFFGGAVVESHVIDI